MRTVIAASIVVLGHLSGCTRAQPLDVMALPAVCDSVPPPLALGERVGGELPSAIASPSDSGMVIGVVLQARTGRALQAASIRLDSVGASVTSTPVRRGISDQMGGFALRPVRPGTYRLRTTLIGHYPRERTVTVRPGAIDTVRTELTIIHCEGY
jgi:hypothetical protein